MNHAKVIKPYDSSAYPTLQYVYDDSYAGPTTRLQIKQRVASGCGTSSCERVTLKFYGGLGRLVQTKAEHQDGTEMIVRTGPGASSVTRGLGATARCRPRTTLQGSGKMIQ